MQRGDGMLAFVVIGALAAFGFVCGVWTLCGIFLKDRGGVLTYQGPQPVEFARRYLWLREMGLIRCQLVVAGNGSDPLSTGGCGSATGLAALAEQPGNCCH